MAAAGSVSIPLKRGASAEALIERLDQYEAISSMAKTSSAVELVKIDIALNCQRFVSRSIESYPQELGIDAEKLLAEADIVQHECERAKVYTPEKAYRNLVRLADSGYVPAQLYFARTMVPVGDDFAARRNGYIDAAMASGSGEAMLLRARDIQSQVRLKERPIEDLELAYDLAVTAIECGYAHPNAHSVVSDLARSGLVNTTRNAASGSLSCSEGRGN